MSSRFFQGLFEKITKENGDYEIIFEPNGPWLPDFDEIDIMISILKNLKTKGGRKEYEDYFKKREEEIKKYESKKNKIIEVKKSGYIYLLKSRNLYKIGRAKNLENRIEFYRTENPFGVKIIFKKEVNDYVKKETELLERFKDKKVRGEWFKLTKEDIKWITQNI